MSTKLKKFDEISTADETEGSPPSQVQKQTVTLTQHPGKNLKDWLNLVGVLAIPLVVVLATIWFGLRQGQLAQQQHDSDQRIANQQRDSDQKIANQRYQYDIQIAATRYAQDRNLAQDNQHQTVLETYLDHMSSLLPALLTSKEGDGVRAVARAQTLAALQQLDSGRKRILLLFLYQAKLINVVNAQDVAHQTSAIVSLSSADLTYVNLSGVDLHDIFLREVNLHGANLSKALLYESNLYSADLSGASLEGADLNGSYLDSADLSGAHLINAMMQGSFFKADLSGANLSGASLEGANLDQANLSGAILSGTKYNTQVVQKTVNGVTYKLPPTKWPKGFDPAAHGAIVKNDRETGP